MVDNDLFHDNAIVGITPHGVGEGEFAAASPTVLGRYEILGKLGSGGMASVYLARVAGESGFQRLCAVKVLHPHLAEEPGFIQMLLDEAQIAARLHHPNVVPIVDLGTHKSIVYVVMDYIEGCSLSALLKKETRERSPRLFVPLILDVLAGLHAAHESADEDGQSFNIVHRDVSPQNMLIGIDGTARITDFGIARASTRITSTQPGQLKGKIAYMAPEQVRSGAIDRRSDVFSAGAVLWSLLSGRKLFVGENDAATLQNILQAEIVPPSTVGFKPPPAFDAVCLRALERDPSRRFTTAAEMEDALRFAAGPNLAPRREITEWIVRNFRDELAERRKAIRTASALPPQRLSAEIPSMASMPSFTPSDSATPIPNAPRVSTLPQTIVSAPPAYEEISTHRPQFPRRRRMAIWAAIPAVAVIAILLWAFAGSSKQPAALPSTPAASTAPAPTAPAPTPTPVAPNVVTPPPPQPERVADPPPSRKPAAAITRPRVQKPAPVIHQPAPVPHHVTPPITPPAPEPTPPKPKWDSDSPVPP